MSPLEAYCSHHEFPIAIPEIPVRSLADAIAYYTGKLGFTLTWSDETGDISGIHRDSCTLYLTSPGFRTQYGNTSPTLIWINLQSKAEVDALYAEWKQRGARLHSQPEDKPWKLREFTAIDLDGNFIRVFYDFRRDV